MRQFTGNPHPGPVRPSVDRWPPSNAAPLPKIWKLAVIVMITCFYIANIYDSSLASNLFYAKWLAALPVVALSWRSVRRSRSSSIKPPSPLPLAIIGFAAFLSLAGAQNVGESAVIFVSLLLALTTAYLLACAIIKSGAELQFFDAITFVGRLVIASAAVMWVMGLNLGRNSGPRFSAWTDNPNTLGLLIAPTIIIVMGEVLSRRRGWLRWSLPFLITGCLLLIATASRASILWVLASAVGYYSFRYGAGRSFLLATLALVVGGVFWGEITSFVFSLIRHEGSAEASDVLSGRSELWPLGLRLFGEQPFLGHGFGSSQSILAKYDWFFVESQGLHFHNSYLTIAVETGAAGWIAVGLALSLSLIGGVLRAKRERREGFADWPLRALPWALAIGSLAHAFFETWILSAGNADMILMWTCFVLLQAKSSAAQRPAHGMALRPGAREAPMRVRR
jgi:O-antigen ligase